MRCSAPTRRPRTEHSVDNRPNFVLLVAHTMLFPQLSHVFLFLFDNRLDDDTVVTVVLDLPSLFDVELDSVFLLFMGLFVWVTVDVFIIAAITAF